jgi:hypothetical protein
MVGSVTFELKDEASIETLDALRDPATAAKHIELQYVTHYTPRS